MSDNFNEYFKSNLRLVISDLIDVLSTVDTITITKTDFKLSEDLYKQVVDFKNQVVYNGDIPF